MSSANERVRRWWGGRVGEVCDVVCQRSPGDCGGRGNRPGGYRIGDKENNVAYIQWAIRLARRGAVIVVDNVIRGGGILAESDDADAVAARRTLQMMGEHPGLDATAIQTVGRKGWDGFALALVR